MFHDDSKIRSAAFSPNGDRLATVAQQIILWDIATEKEVRRGGPSAHGYCVSYAPDAETIVWSGYDANVHVVDAKTLDPTMEFAAHSRSPVEFATFSPQGDLLASVATGGEVIVWDVKSGKAKWQKSGDFRCVAFSPDGTLVAASGTAKGIKLFDRESGVEQATLAADAYRFQFLVFSRDSEMLAAAESNTISLWNVATRTLITELKGHHGMVKCLAISADGRLLLSGGAEGEIILWDLTADHAAGKRFGHSATDSVGKS